MHLVDLCLNLIRFQWVLTQLWRHLSFLQTMVHSSNSIEPTNFILGTNVHVHNMDITWRSQVKVKGHRKWRNQATSNDISFLDLEVKSRSHVTVKVTDVEVSVFSECFLLKLLFFMLFLKGIAQNIFLTPSAFPLFCGVIFFFLLRLWPFFYSIFFHQW